MSSTRWGGTLPEAAELPEEELHRDEELPEGETGFDPVGYLKYVPVVTFGLRVAALAGIAITVGVGEAVGLSGIFDSPNVVANGGSTCCITVAPY